MIIRNRGNVMIAFLLIIVLSFVAFSLFYTTGGRLRGATGQTNYTKALYVAEAGLNKAIWYLTTPTGQGGKGTTWRTAGEKENYGEGSYTMTVLSSSNPDGILITSSGEVRGVVRKVQAKLVASELPAAFDYALYNNGNLTVGGSVTIRGDVFANGDATINNPASVLSGEVFVPDGGSVSGSGTYTNGGTLDDPPQMPFLDTSYYSGAIATAALLPMSNLMLDNYDLAGQTLYVNGNVEIRGTLTGVGKIITTGVITFENATTAPGIEYISGDYIKISGTSNVGDALIFAENYLSITGTPRVEGSILSSSIKIAGTPSIFGIVYAWDVSVSLGTANIYGSVVNPTSQSLSGNVSITFDPAYLPATPPPGMTAGGYRMLPGSWKEI